MTAFPADAVADKNRILRNDPEAKFRDPRISDIYGTVLFTFRVMVNVNSNGDRSL